MALNCTGTASTLLKNYKGTPPLLLETARTLHQYDVKLHEFCISTLDYMGTALVLLEIAWVQHH